jgi:hypothetical protein
MIAGGIRHALRQLQGHMPRRRARRFELEIPQAGRIAHEFVVAEDKKLAGAFRQHGGARAIFAFICNGQCRPACFVRLGTEHFP